MTQLLERRRLQAAELISKAGMDAACFIPGPNFYYLTGLTFPLMERPTILILTKAAEVVGIIPELERLKWSETFPHAHAHYWQDKDGFDSAFAAAAAGLGKVSLGVEGGRMRMFEYAALCRHFSPDAVTDADQALADLRVAKDAKEVACLKRAIEISEIALDETIAEVCAGMTEAETINLLKTRMLANGAEGFSFEPIVLSGGKAANPHGMPDATVLRAGDALLFDFGARNQGYNADITRTFFVERVSSEHQAIYETVLAANATGRKACSPEMTAHDLDVLVTGELQQSPFADMIVHKTGHGLGLDVHEVPQVMVGNHSPLVPGTVITIEPGLYRAGDVGVRIEDNVLVEKEGSRSLTSFRRELEIIGKR